MKVSSPSNTDLKVQFEVPLQMASFLVAFLHFRSTIYLNT